MLCRKGVLAAESLGCSMLDREGFRPNVGIILLNTRNEVWWGKRVREHSWQFPQGGIKFGETPEQAMFRELEEEVGLRSEHVKIVGRTRDWLRYEVPDRFIKREIRGHYRGQKQIWFLLRMVGRDCDINLRLTEHPEFDAWRWHDYWVPLDVVIEFKRDVYLRALQELSRFLTRPPASGGALKPGAPFLNVDQAVVQVHDLEHHLLSFDHNAPIKETGKDITGKSDIDND